MFGLFKNVQVCSGSSVLAGMALFLVSGVGFAGNSQPSNSPKGRELTQVETFLKKELEVEELASYSLFRALEERAHAVALAQAQSEDPDSIQKISRELALRAFAPSSAETLGGIFRALGRTEYSNSIVLGQAGVGKSFLIHQLVAMYSVGVVPDFLLPQVGGQNGVAFKSLRDAYLGNTDIYLINMDLLSMDHTKKGQPWSTADVRMRTTLTALFSAAKQEFNRKDDQGNRIGRRSVFVIDEVATLPDLVQTTLKKILDETGFKNPHDPILSTQDCGYSVVAMTTPDEYRYMVKGDSAVERRYYKVLFSEISEAEALEILKAKSIEWNATYGVQVDEEALKLIIRMRKLLNSPPLAMPGSILAATNDLFLWKLKKGVQADSVGTEISLQDAKRFIIESYGLTELWFEGPNGEAPFQGLAEKIKERVVGQDEVVDRIAARVQAWGRMGFGRDVPVFFLGGTSGSGKDTLIKTLNTLLFGHSGQHLMFSLGGIEGFGINSIIEGPPLGNHSDQSQGLLVQALENGPAQGIITFNEGKDAPSMELEKLKVFIESGEIRPKGRDARVRPIHFPVFVLGQWGEEIFLEASGKVKTDSEIAQIRAGLSQSQLEDFFLSGKGDGRTGGVSRALLDRAKNTGGVFIMAPVSRDLLSKIAQIKANRIVDDLRNASNISLTIDTSILELIAQQAEAAGEGARAIEATTIDFTEGALNEAMNQGMPIRDLSLLIQVDASSSGERLLITSTTDQKKWTVEVVKVRRIKMVRDCANILSTQ